MYITVKSSEQVKSEENHGIPLTVTYSFNFPVFNDFCKAQSMDVSLESVICLAVTMWHVPLAFL